VTITVRLFASLRERAGVGRLTRSVPEGTTAGALLAALQEDLPALRASGRIALAVNSEYTNADQRLADGDELALIPPVSGGSGPRFSASAEPRARRGAPPWRASSCRGRDRVGR
jgi:MoaE-MoaD fusion protein